MNVRKQDYEDYDQSQETYISLQKQELNTFFDERSQISDIP